MAHPLHHAESSARNFGGVPSDYQAVHDWFDASKEHLALFTHRALRHHAQGLFEAERVFGLTLTNSAGRDIPVRWIGEQHVREDYQGRIPSMADWLRRIQPDALVVALDDDGAADLLRELRGSPDSALAEAKCIGIVPPNTDQQQVLEQLNSIRNRMDGLIERPFEPELLFELLDEIFGDESDSVTETPVAEPLSASLTDALETVGSE